MYERVLVCGCLSVPLLVPSKAFGDCREAPLLAHRDRNWFPLQL